MSLVLGTSSPDKPCGLVPAKLRCYVLSFSLEV